MRKWLENKDCVKENNVGIWWDYDKRKVLGGIGCSRELRKLLDEIGIDK
jgi:hypothetical protein